MSRKPTLRSIPLQPDLPLGLSESSTDPKPIFETETMRFISIPNGMKKMENYQIEKILENIAHDVIDCLK